MRRVFCFAAAIALGTALLVPVGASADSSIFQFGYSTGFNTPLVVAAPGLLVPIGQGLPCPNAAITTLVTAPSHGILSLPGNGAFGYVPNPGFSGADFFTYLITDPCGLAVFTFSGSVAITVWPAPLTTLVGQTFVTPYDHFTLGFASCNATGPSTFSFEAQNQNLPPYNWDEQGTFTLDSPNGPLSAFQATFTIQDLGQPNIVGTVALAAPGSGSCAGTQPLLPSSVQFVAQTSYSTTGLVVETGFAPTTLDFTNPDAAQANFWQGPFTALAGPPGNTPTGAAVTVSFNSGVTVTFAGVTQAGDTTVTSSPPSSPPVPNGYVTTGNYYFVSTTAAFTTAVVCITDNNIHALPTAALLHYDTSTASWMDVTDYVNYPVPHIHDTICSTPLTSLSPFVIATPPVVVVAAINQAYSTPFITPLTVAAPGLLSGDSGTGITVTSTTPPAHGTLSSVGTDGSFTYTPNAAFSGTDTFTYTITDSSSHASTATVTITVGLPPPPVAIDHAYFPPLGTVLTVVAPGLLSGDSGTGITVTATSTPGHGTLSSVGTDGSFSYTPTCFLCTDSFTYTITDSASQTATATVVITVVLPLPPPPVAKNQAYATPFNTPLIVPAPGLLFGDSGTGITVTGTTTPGHGALSAVGTDGTFTYTPTTGFSGPDTFLYMITDSFGQTATATVAITIVLPPPPVAVDHAYSTPFNTALTPDLLVGDSGAGIYVSLITKPGHGTIPASCDIFGNCSFTYTPNAGFSGNDTFSYTITDSAKQTATAAVTITVGAPPLPVAINQAYSTPFNTTLTVAAPGLLSGDSGTGTKVTATTTPGHGALSPVVADGSFTYTPITGFSGTDTFTYTITDSASQTATATVTITVVPPPPPVANNQAYSTPFNTPLTVPAPGLLFGDSGTGIKVTATSAPSRGTLSPVAADGSFTYAPNAGVSGTDTFTYTITDSASQTATGTVTITVGRPPFIIPAGDTATFTNPQFGACNHLSWGYQLNGGTNVVEFTKPLSCDPGPTTQNAGPNVTIGPFATPMTLLVFLSDITCGITYYSDGTPVDHVIVSGSNPYFLRFADAGGACERKFVTLTTFTGFNFQVNLTIADQPITATGTNISTAEGQPFSGAVATFTDPTTFSTSGEYTATIDWGDGSSSPANGQPVTISGNAGGPFMVNGSHTYKEEGTYTVKVHITDTDSTNAADATSTATVLDAALTASPACLANSLPSYNGPTATFTDAAGPSYGTLDDFSATINWGDGNITTGVVSGNNGGPYTVSGAHAYATTGYFTITTSIKDVGGATATASCKVLTFTFAPGGGSFVIGDNQNAAIGNSVTFWDSSWLQDNSLSSGPHSFKGFAQNPTTPTCGAGWSADTGNSTPPPAGPLPAFMAVIVTSSATQSGSTVSGNTVHIVIVQTNPGYAPDPGHAGTGKVVATVC